MNEGKFDAWWWWWWDPAQETLPNCESESDADITFLQVADVDQKKYIVLLYLHVKSNNSVIIWRRCHF